jgi:hypothetical protein
MPFSQNHHVYVLLVRSSRKLRALLVITTFMVDDAIKLYPVALTVSNIKAFKLVFGCMNTCCLYTPWVMIVNKLQSPLMANILLMRLVHQHLNSRVVINNLIMYNQAMLWILEDVTMASMLARITYSHCLNRQLSVVIQLTFTDPIA